MGVLCAHSHLQEEETVRRSCYKMKDGGSLLLQILVAFVKAFPQHLLQISRAFFFPLIREQHLVIARLGTCATTQYRETTDALFRSISGCDLPELLSHILEAGHF